MVKDGKGWKSHGRGMVRGQSETVGGLDGYGKGTENGKNVTSTVISTC